MLGRRSTTEGHLDARSRPEGSRQAQGLAVRAARRAQVPDAGQGPRPQREGASLPGGEQGQPDVLRGEEDRPKGRQDPQQIGRRHPMPAKTEKQRRFTGAELERKREGKKTQTGMSESELEKMASKKSSSSKSKKR